MKATEFTDWVVKEIDVCRESGYMSDEGLLRHIKEHAGYFGISRSKAEQQTLQLMKDLDAKD